MPQALNDISETPSQTAGPYVQLGCTPNFAGLSGVYPEDIGLRAIEDGARGTRITIRGHVFDNNGDPMFDPMIESWQPDASGLFPGQDGADACVNGFCRFPLDKNTGQFVLHTVKPGRVPFRNGGYQAPHISLWIVARGNNIGLNTRLYFDDEHDQNVADPILKRVRPQKRLQTLLARQCGQGEYQFDIHLRGDQETVFFDM